MPAAAGELERLTGVVERVSLHQGQNGFWMLRLKVKGERELITQIGPASPATTQSSASS